ncbi:MAG: Rpn family recombination-promoting nuclease/putative transposase, partial [Niameybacter sp.]
MKKDIHHIHDKTYRSFFENKEIFLQLLQSFVQEAWTTQLQVDKLIEDKSHYILRDFEEAEADIVYHATIEGQEVVFCILLELQSTVDHSMGIRLFYYISEIWRKYLKRFEREEVKRKDFKLPAVVPIVLYNGESGWTATTQFKEKVQ